MFLWRKMENYPNFPFLSGALKRLRSVCGLFVRQCTERQNTAFGYDFTMLIV